MTILNVSDPETAKKIDDIINNSKHAFILIYMVGCGPCNATRPEWKKMCYSLEDKYLNNTEVAILDIDSKFIDEISGIGKIDGFPTMKYINKNNNLIEDFESSNIPNKKRNSASFIKWINSKLSSNLSSKPKKTKSSSVHDLTSLLSRTQRHSAPTRQIRKIKRKRTTKKRFNKRKASRKMRRNK